MSGIRSHQVGLIISEGGRKGRLFPAPWKCLSAIASWGLLSLLPNGECDAATVRTSEAHNLALAIYSEDSLEKVGVLKVEKVFTDHRHLGFLSVKLLPVVVARGVRLELAASTPATNWQTCFHANLMPSAQSRGVEWRDCSIWLPNEMAPRLQAACLTLSGPESSQFCALENVILQTDSGPIKLSRARLSITGAPGQVVWQHDGISSRWNLFTKEISTHKPAS